MNSYRFTWSCLSKPISHQSDLGLLSAKHFLLVLIPFISLVNTVFSVNYTWVSNSNTSWSTSTNWSPNGVPGNGDAVTIAASSASPVITSFSGSLSSLTINATQTLTINSATLTVSGMLTLYCGNASAGSTINGTGVISPNGGITVTNNAAGTIGSTIGCTVSLTSSSISMTINSGGSTASDLIISGNMSGTMGFTKSGAGILVLSGNNSGLSGPITESAGRLCLNHQWALGTGLFTINGSCELDNTSNASITLSSSNILSISSGFTFIGTNNLLFGSGDVSVGSNITIVLSGSNKTLTFNGKFINTSASNQTITVNGSGNTLSIGAYDISNSATNRTLTLAGSANITITGVVANGGTATASAFTYSGTGKCTLTGANTFAGAFTVSTGTVAVNTLKNAGTASSCGNGSSVNAITIGGTAILLYEGTGDAFNRPIAISSGASIQASGSDTLFVNGGVTGTNASIILSGTGQGKIASTGIATGSGTLVKRGTGGWTLSAISTYTGTTTISEGTMVAGASIYSNVNGPFGRSSSNIFLGDATTTTNNASPTFLFGNADTIARGINITANNTTGSYSFGGNLDKTTVIAGSISVNNPVTVTYVATTNNNNLEFRGGASTGTGSTGITRLLTFNHTGPILITSGTFSNGTGLLAVSKSGTGTLTLSANSTYTGGFTLNAGTVNINNSSAIGGNTNTIRINGGSVGNNSGSTMTLVMPIVIGGNFTFFGTNTLILNGSTSADLSLANLTITANNTNGSSLIFTPATFNLATVNLTKEGNGILQIGASTNNINSLIINNGTFNLFNTLNLYGDFTLNQNGTFSFGTSSIQFVGSTTQSINGKAVTFPPTTVSNPNGVICLTSININGNFSFSGSLSSLSIEAGTSFTINGSIFNSTVGNCFKVTETSNLIINSLTSNRAIYFDPSYNRINSLTINFSNIYNLTLGNELTIVGSFNPISGQLITNEYLTIESNENGTGSVTNGGCVTCSYFYGNVYIKRYIPSVARRWRFLSSPIGNNFFTTLQNDIYVTGTGGANHGFDVTTSNYPSIYYYNESAVGNQQNGWLSPTDINNDMFTGVGYRVFIRGDRSDPGRLDGTNDTQNAVTLNHFGSVNMGTISIPVTYTNTGNSQDDGWNFIGNPFPCSIDWNLIHDNGRTGTTTDYSGTSYAHIDASAYYYEASTNSYSVYNAVTNLGTGSFSTGLIPSGGAFFVKTQTSSPSLSILESHKSVSAPTGSMFKQDSPQPLRIKLIKDEINSDEIAVFYLEGALNSNDQYDVAKLFNSEVNLAALSVDTQFQTIMVRSIQNKFEDSIPLSIGVKSNGNYTLSFTNNKSFVPNDTIDFYLVDKYLGITKNLKTDSIYTFNADLNIPNSFGTNRFYISINKLTNATLESLQNHNEFLSGYPNPTNKDFNIRIPSINHARLKVTISDVLGAEYKSTFEVDKDTNLVIVKTTILTPGLYFIRLNNSEQQFPPIKLIKY